jgi:hypothetical protein
MSVIKPATTSAKEKVKIVISADVLKDVKEYCEWAKVNESEFFEQAAKFVFNKDKDWKHRNKKQKNRA